MDPIVVHIHPRLDSVGDTMPVAGHIDMAGYDLGSRHLLTPEGVSYDLLLTNTSEGILLSGSVKAPIIGECARCLESANEDIKADAEGYFLFDAGDCLDETATDASDDLDQDFCGIVDSDGCIDVSDSVQAALAFATPFVMLCSPECKGLCPTCGANLNEGPCSCTNTDDIDSDNPFSVLKDFDFGQS